ncbi:MAG: hypothetical protein IH936_14360 [Acidobacteria bacterium]|nr:hypothetical protein [Acidobacteriota bacterium]
MAKKKPPAWPQTEPADLLTAEELKRLDGELRELVAGESPRGSGLYAENHRRIARHNFARSVALECAGYESNPSERLLRTLGTPEKLEELILHALAASEGIHRLEDSGLLKWSEAWEFREYRYGSIEDDFREMEKRLEQYYRFLLAAKQEAESAVTKLRKLGWRFDESAGYSVKAGVSYRPTKAINVAVSCLCKHWKVKWNYQETRDSIALAFRNLFPPEQLGTEHKGPIWSAVNNYLHSAGPQSEPETPSGE